MKIEVQDIFEQATFPMVKVKCIYGEFSAKWYEMPGEEIEFPAVKGNSYLVEIDFNDEIELEVNSRLLKEDEGEVVIFSKGNETIFKGEWDGYDIVEDDDVEKNDMGYFRIGSSLLMMVECQNKFIKKGTPLEIRARSTSFTIFPHDPA